MRPMKITLDLPDNLSLTEADLRKELAIALFQQDYISLGRASKIAGIYIMALLSSQWILYNGGTF
ncbi:MAG: hypothetical protein RLZZ435_3250 [Cyanobacteriota bacterium]|jgi:predicted HTH domain antitoxin